MAFEIPVAIAKQAMKLTFTGDKSKTAMGHLHAIEDLCSLFKLADVPHDHVKRNLLYLSLSGNARIWFRSLDFKCRFDWELLRKAFYTKFYNPKEAYDDRCHIYNFWPHLGESIAQAWGDLMNSSVRILVMVFLIVLY